MPGPIKAERIVKNTFRIVCSPWRLGTAAALVACLVAGPALAEDDLGKGSEASDISLGLDPAAPQAATLPGGLTPSFGQASVNEGEWRFDFHGFFTGPLNIGINSRKDPRPGQGSTVLHSPPVVPPDDLETFSHTGVVPMTYAQINFSEGNSVITAHLNLLARQMNTSTGFLEPASQLLS